MCIRDRVRPRGSLSTEGIARALTLAVGCMDHRSHRVDCNGLVPLASDAMCLSRSRNQPMVRTCMATPIPADQGERTVSCIWIGRHEERSGDYIELPYARRR